MGAIAVSAWSFMRHDAPGLVDAPNDRLAMMPAQEVLIGAYRILQRIGSGGMGAVYLGEHTLLGRKAAIKVLRSSLSADTEIVTRFFNEARAVTLIADPGIVQVFDFGVHTDGRAFIVMELLEGEPMDRRLRRIERMDLLECLRFARMMCSSDAGAVIPRRDLRDDGVSAPGRHVHRRCRQ